MIASLKGLINYQLEQQHITIGDVPLDYVCIQNLDQAIDQLCFVLEAKGQSFDPFAPDLCPYFGRAWNSALGLCTWLSSQNNSYLGQSFLEIGCGLALPSILISKLQGQVFASDFHPDVEIFLAHNSKLNKVAINYTKAHWAIDPMPLAQFDWVIGSDILYEGAHPDQVAKALHRFVKPGGKIVLADPGRSYLQQFVKAMNNLNLKEELIPISSIEGEDIYILHFQC